MNICSDGILEEVARTLAAFKRPLPQVAQKRWLRAIRGGSLWVEPDETLRVVDDPDDDKFVMAALAGNAGFIVSQDNHLLRLKDFQGIRCVSPDEFLGKPRKPF